MPNKIKAEPATPYDKQSTINFHFGKNSKLQPKGMENLSMDASVTVMLKGTVKSFNSDNWDQSKNFSLAMTSCTILTPQTAQEKSIMDEALNEAQKKLKKVK